MKRFLLVALIAVVAISFTACGSSKMGGQVKGDSYISEGWVTPDIFRVTATGAPKPGLKDRVMRRGTAKEAAIAMAEKRIVEKFKGARLEGAAGAADYASTGVAVAKEFEGLVKGGTIVKETYDEEDHCEIVYQIEKKGLKKEVEGGAY
ncbi:MAG TPA: hypothetical protein PLN01_05660 [Spirochaetota bacterium]|nr:hypothetical protein [Spirochaetota bacterium]HOF13789.1 hypothetical protein [Spirochaetota bacterium]HOM88529.1 hypothetical protein [Spirochaetota bacterium]HPD04884.1 hypothetical protein [Spirochaetota bacterium]